MAILGNNSNLTLGSGQVIDDTSDSDTDLIKSLGGGYKIVYGNYNDVIFTPPPAYSTDSGSALILDGNTILLGSGNNVVYGDIHDMTMLGSVGGSFMNEKISFDSNIISAGSGTNIIYGDMRDFSESLLGGLNTSASINGINFTLSSNSINVGSGTNTIFGNMQDLSLSVTGGTSNDGGFAFNSMDNSHFTMQGNTITAGSGINVVYGNLRNLSETVGGDSVSNGGTIGDELSASVNLGGNTINLASGVNTIYGALQNATLTVIGSTSTNGFSDVGLGPNYFNNDKNVINVSSNSITVGDGRNVIYGDMQDLAMIINAGSNMATDLSLGSQNLVDDEIWQNNISFSGNQIKAGNGSNTIYGNLHDFTFNVNGGYLNPGASYIQISPNHINFDNAPSQFVGGNTIQAGDGQNVIYGALHDMEINELGGTKVLPIINHNLIDWESSIAMKKEHFVFGDNHIVAGNGVDIVYGDFHVLGVSLTGGINDGGSAYKSTIIMDNNTIQLGNGNDVVYGNGQNISITEVGGVGQSAADGEIYFENNTISMGSDNITVGNGNNTIYGDVQNFNVALIGGQNTPATFDNNSVTMGTNTITVGSGTDTVYGSMQNLSINDSHNSTFHDNHITFGNNTLNGGIGIDALVGDFQNMLVALSDNSVFQNNTITFGDNTLNGGSGNDILVGDFGSMSYANDGTSVANNNTITFGKNTFNAGDGNDVLYANVVDGADLAAFTSNHTVPSLASILVGQMNFQVFNLPSNPNNDANFANGFLPFTGATPDGDLSLLQSGSTPAIPPGPLYGGNPINSHGNSDYTSLATNLSASQQAGSTPFAMEFEGTINITTPGQYIFYTTADDNTDLYIDGNLVVNGDVAQAAIEHVGVVNLSTGNHTIVVTYLEQYQGYYLDFGITSPTFNNVIKTGTNTFNLGNGHDTVNFSAAIDLGTNIINNWNANTNTLQFNNVGDPVHETSAQLFADLLNQIHSIGNDGQGGTLIQFNLVDGNLHNTSTIDFTNVGYHGESAQNWLTAHVPHLVVV